MAHFHHLFRPPWHRFANGSVGYLGSRWFSTAGPKTTITSFATVEASPIEKPSNQTVKVSKAMKAYLERARAHDEFMKVQNLEYSIGKRHLANMMGEDPETFTQEDIDRAIQYLFPSGLYDKKARPMMKPPEEVIPQRKAAEFDESGRPFHSMFYTGRPNYSKLLFDIVENINNLNSFEDRMIRKQLSPDPNQKLNPSGSDWLSKDAIEKLLLEDISDNEYDNFVKAMERLFEHPYAYREKDFLNKYRKSLLTKSDTDQIPKPQFDEKGRNYITVYECLRKSARADVTIIAPGTGKITINGQDITYFEDVQPREQILFPLIYTDMVGKVDVVANVAGGGFSGQAGAIRWGIAMGLRSFIDQETTERMRLAGLLQRDYRRRERKKPGQAGARRKYTWKKR
ncbi:28S ribosomal protein S9, mitochondrial [Uranotaenia lowii]|uniref:28S ribosomal protein S9, mitochondrial n=1 Tax=Uranotaenia lowii TaxID=190385 RepID=UPI002479C70E|nr:28S ribosomal protein S9, mitochondrial [Uranotaenia lowii]XP_055603402.1 28S ribosomal protein S9, mitochondrial [Uranotaenia lowii]